MPTPNIEQLKEDARKNLWDSCKEYTDDGAQELGESSVEEYLDKVIEQSYTLGKQEGRQEGVNMMTEHYNLPIPERIRDLLQAATE